MTTLLSVKNGAASEPWPCIAPKNGFFWPANGKEAMAAAMPRSTPMLPVCTVYQKPPALRPLCVQMPAALPMGPAIMLPRQRSISASGATVG